MSALDSNFLTLLRVHLVSVLKLPKVNLVAKRIPEIGLTHEFC